MESCPNCQSKKYIKNGSVRGKKRYKCKKCGYTFTQQNPQQKYPLRQKKIFVRRFLKGESLRSIETSQEKKYRKRPTNVAIIYWFKKLDKAITNPDDTEQKCNFTSQDKQKFQELIEFLNGRSIRKIKKDEWKKSGLKYVYIIFKMLEALFPDRKINETKLISKTEKKKAITEERQLEKVYEYFLSKKRSAQE